VYKNTNSVVVFMYLYCVLCLSIILCTKIYQNCWLTLSYVAYDSVTYYM